MKLLDEFKAFALKGSVIDLAVGVIIGGAFGKIVSSLVSDIIMPPLGWIIGGVDFSNLKWTLPGDTAVTINYGQFIQTTFDFVIIACAVFFAIKALIKLKVKEDKKQDTPPAPTITPDQALLTEIRDLLKDKK